MNYTSLLIQTGMEYISYKLKLGVVDEANCGEIYLDEGETLLKYLRSETAKDHILSRPRQYRVKLEPISANKETENSDKIV